MTEQQLQKKIIDFLHAQNAYTVKVIQANKRGVPDILACWRGIFIAIECKSPAKKAKPDPLQEWNMERIAEAGGVSLCCNSFEFFTDNYWPTIVGLYGPVKYLPLGRVL